MDSGKMLMKILLLVLAMVNVLTSWEAHHQQPSGVERNDEEKFPSNIDQDGDGTKSEFAENVDAVRDSMLTAPLDTLLESIDSECRDHVEEVFRSILDWGQGEIYEQCQDEARKANQMAPEDWEKSELICRTIANYLIHVIELVVRRGCDTRKAKGSCESCESGNHVFRHSHLPPDASGTLSALGVAIDIVTTVKEELEQHCHENYCSCCGQDFSITDCQNCCYDFDH